MVESLQMFLFLFKSKYRRKCSWFSPFLCSVLIVLLFCDGVLSKCEDHTCVNGVCKNDMCVCYEGWQGPECQYCGGKVKTVENTDGDLYEISTMIFSAGNTFRWPEQCDKIWYLKDAIEEKIAVPTLANSRGFYRVPEMDKFMPNLTSPTGFITDGPGNYSVSTQCSWLLTPPRLGPTPPPLRVRLESFATECGWDHLYVYDGDSVRAEKLLAVFSGVLENGESSWTRQVIARSGSALLHFFNHGECEDGSCRCEPEWTGVACDEPLCPEECNAAYGGGTCTRSGCACSALKRGIACARDAWRAGWAPPTHSGDTPPVAAHVLLPYGDDLYKTAEQEWEVLPTYDSPAPRFAHSAVLYGHELIVYGGVVISDEPERGGGLAGLEGRAGEVTNEIWRVRLNSERPQWHNATPITCSPHRQPPLKHCGGLHVSGHTAVLVYLGVTKKPVMLVFFGHSPHYGYLHLVQEYYVDEGVWAVAATRGWAARAGFGHAAAWDPLSRRVYLHGGLVSESEATQAPSASLFEYDPELRLWRPLQSAPTPRYLHSATFITPGVMLVFGGNAHNDSAAALVASPAASKCYSAGALLYDVRCGVWWNAAGPRAGARAAHAAAPIHTKDRRAVLIHAGFDGRLRSDALIFEAGEGCARHTSEASCLTAAQHTAIACLEEVGWKESFDGTVKACLTEPRFGKDERRCSMAESCAACTAARCAWCGACYVSATYCIRHTHQMALSLEECGSDSESPREACARYHSCAACLAHQHHHTHGSEELSQRACFWDYDTIKCKPVNSSEDIRSVAAAGPCSAPCSTFQTCANCTAEECIWCASAGRCVDKNAYGASFPLGDGTSQRVHNVSATGTLYARSLGAAYSPAPAGPSGTTASCVRPATGGTRSTGASASVSTRGEPYRAGCRYRGPGDHCQLCAPGHWGNPLNGGVCQREYTGEPYRAGCRYRGPGDHCQLCAPGHWGNPLNGGVCQRRGVGTAAPATTASCVRPDTGGTRSTGASASVSTRGEPYRAGCRYRGPGDHCQLCAPGHWGNPLNGGVCQREYTGEPYRAGCRYRGPGDHCQLCAPGHWGNPLNGGVCQREYTGEPYRAGCRYRGPGDHCQLCAPGHWGNPLNGGVCQRRGVGTAAPATTASCVRPDTGGTRSTGASASVSTRGEPYRAGCRYRGPGDHCQLCAPGHWGNPLNGGVCQREYTGEPYRAGCRYRGPGDHCQLCAPGHWGNPLNGGVCQREYTGEPYRAGCRYRGPGDHCQLCAPGHWGNPLNGGVCQREYTGEPYRAYRGPGDHCQLCAPGHWGNPLNGGVCQREYTGEPYRAGCRYRGPGDHCQLCAPGHWGNPLNGGVCQREYTGEPYRAGCRYRGPGDHCQLCAPGHWGNPLNGGVCQPCECNAQAVACAPDTGRCYCSTKGLAGDRCDKCDNTNHYHADIYNKGACYYDLAVDYQFTFNLSKKEDRHLSAINFRNAPVKPDVDADFSITCSAHARMNLTVRTRSDPAERTLFAKSEHAFGVEDNVTLTTFFVYVYDFRPPLWIQISFSQYPKLNLQQFFITFSSCFLLLLLVAAALWKIKQKYDMYRRRQRLFVEMEQMASRPFSQVSVELEKGGAGAGVPAPVALEPCRGGRAAVLSLLVRLPTGGTGRAPPLGGLAVASALVTLGHHAAPLPHHKRPRHH
ncbi:hypothetical protein HW555_012646 [Spodoptera exigua]|uniref:PSI domain-containing protein n=1 Tax=Spodoptera exigua TaxID=7107 RepID=A0A835G4R4_SPOEX|nr:hypothetical protein HW555_012646 [Spodoptera exigua]